MSLLIRPRSGETSGAGVPRRDIGRMALAALLVCLVGWSSGAWAQAQERSVSVGGVQRSYLLFVPPGVSNPAPLVMVFHGGGGRAQGIMRSTGMNAVAERGRFIVAYPQGEGRGGGKGTWNIGGPNSASSANDIGFVQAMLADIERSYPIDRRRIFATGESMGGVFAYRLACEMSDTFAAIAPVAATMVQPNCAPRSPVAVLHIQGSADQNIPLNGGTGSMTGMGRAWPSPRGAVDFWARADGCSPAVSSRQDGPDTTCQTHTTCRSTVEMCIVNGGGHAWPGSPPQRWQQRYRVYVSQNFPASQRIWEFFAAHPKQ
ncbi:MAG: polyhydroxybutyrate depolymerase [Proteobacteria bacterium]|nr:polyhydroxybutyrate depolymerase [Pseudomonadota bacterium]